MSEKKFEELNLNDAFLFAAALQNPDTCRLILELILDQPVPKVNVHTEHALLYNSDFRSARLCVRGNGSEDLQAARADQGAEEKP